MESFQSKYELPRYPAFKPSRCMEASNAATRERSEDEGIFNLFSIGKLIQPGRPPHDSNWRTQERVRVHNCLSSPVRHAGTIHSEASKPVRRLQTEGSARPHHIGDTDMQSYHKGT